jgi:hypothetical protein
MLDRLAHHAGVVSPRATATDPTTCDLGRIPSGRLGSAITSADVRISGVVRSREAPGLCDHGSPNVDVVACGDDLPAGDGDEPGGSVELPAAQVRRLLIVGARADCAPSASSVAVTW